MAERLPLLALIALVCGYLLWSVAFIAFYAGHSVACATMPSAQIAGLPAASIVVGAFWAAHVAAHLVLWRWLVGRRFRGERDIEGATFLKRCALALALAAGVSTVMTGLPVLFVAPCI